MSAIAAKMIDCPVCQQQHETMLLHGMEFVPCPRVPPDTIIPISTAGTKTGNVSREIESIKRTLYNAIDKLNRMAEQQ